MMFPRSLKKVRPEHSIFNFIGVADCVTLLGLTFSVLSIFASLSGSFILAACSILVSVVCDFFDGMIARKLGQEGEFGVAIDGFNDFLTFLVAVVVFGYAAGLQTPVAYICFAIFIVLGTLRLARFSITGTVDGYYEGLPASYSFLIIPAYFFLQKYDLSINFLLPLYVVPAFFMISTIRVRKPGVKKARESFGISDNDWAREECVSEEFVR